MRDLFLEIHADRIAEAASSFDGHVTHGSLEALIRCFSELMADRIQLELEKGYLRARGQEPGVTDRFITYGTSQMYWKGRADAARAIRAYKESLKDLDHGTESTSSLREQG